MTDGIIRANTWSFDEGLMGKTEQDRIEDFTDVYDFAEEFDWERRPRDVRRKKAK